MTRRGPLPASFRARILLVVLFAAVVPLGLIGFWLTRAVVRAGTNLLGSELDQSLARVAAGLELRWGFRTGELELLVNNGVASRVVSRDSSVRLSAADSLFLRQLAGSVARAILQFEYRDATGTLRWSSTASIDSTEVRASSARRAKLPPTIAVHRAIPGSRRGASAGEVVAHIDLFSLIAVDTSFRLPNGARLQVTQRDAPHSLLPAFAPDSLLALNRFTMDGATWLAVHRSVVEPPLTLTIAAPLGAYVEPFERAARAGVITLGVVAAFALLLSAWLTTQLTSSLEQLAVGADAVAAGDLDHRVDGSGAGEVARLADAFNSMTERLRQTLTELTNRRAFAAVGEYAALLAHQVRNGLTAVRVDLQRAQDRANSDLPLAPLVDRALTNVERLNDTVSASLRGARSSRIPRRSVDLRSVLRSAVQMADGAFAERGASCDGIGPDGESAWVRGDATALEQLFLNLLLNAAQASERGARASVAIDVDASEWRVMVSDTGGGIPPEHLDRVLDPFFSTKADGTGLGLPIARQIAVAHGGSLRIESASSAGTRVEVRLPIAATA